MLKTCLLITGLCSAFSASAAYTVGTVTEVITYANNDRILVRMDNMPEKSVCKSSVYFSIEAKTPADRRHQVLSRALTAFATGKRTKIYYSDKDCDGSYIKLVRIG